MFPRATQALRRRRFRPIHPGEPLFREVSNSACVISSSRMRSGKAGTGPGSKSDGSPGTAAAFWGQTS